jgi:hypothetical protein
MYSIVLGGFVMLAFGLIAPYLARRSQPRPKPQISRSCLAPSSSPLALRSLLLAPMLNTTIG